jgi:polar amino acid transport system substrate-binding protein
MNKMLMAFVLIISLSSTSCTKKDENTFSFASSGEFKPFSYLDNTGTLQGYDIDVGRELARRLDKEPRPMMYRFGGIVEGVKSGRFDAAVASHTITAERAQHVAFTDPYYFSGPQVFTRKDQSLQELQELNEADIAVSRGSTYVDVARQWSENLHIYDSDIVALEALNRGRHRFVITDSIAGAMAIERGLILVAGPMLGESQQAIAVALENQQLLERLNELLREMKADGTLQAISEKHFGVDITQSSVEHAQL